MAEVQTYNAIAAEHKTFYEKTLLTRARPKLTFMKFGQKRPMPKHEGKTANYRRFESLPPATTPITEGVVPAGSALSVSSYTAVVEEYGDFVKITERLANEGIDPVLTETSELLGEQAGDTLDAVVRNVVCAGTNVQYATGKANANALAAGDVMTGAEIKKAVRTLRKANIKVFSDGCYVGIVNPDVAFDLMNDTLWQDVSKYNGGTKIMQGEIGKIHGVRFLETTQTKTYQNTASTPLTVQCSMIIGKDAYGTADIDGSSAPQMIVKQPGSGGTSDPLNQIASAGWKAKLAVVRLNELGMVRIESTATA